MDAIKFGMSWQAQDWQQTEKLTVKEEVSNPSLEEMLSQLKCPLQLSNQDLKKYTTPFAGGAILPRFPAKTLLDLRLQLATSATTTTDATTPSHPNPAQTQISQWVSLMGPPQAPASRYIGNCSYDQNASSSNSSCCSSPAPEVNNLPSDTDLLYVEPISRSESGGTKQAWDQLLLIVQEMRRDIRPCYAGNKACIERMKKSINQARLLLKETAHELEHGK